MNNHGQSEGYRVGIIKPIVENKYHFSCQIFPDLLFLGITDRVSADSAAKTVVG